MKTITVTGATGFIGNHVVSYLQAYRDDYRVVAVGRDPEKLEKLIQQYGVDVLAVDIHDEVDNWFSFLGKPDILIHLAWGGLDNYMADSHFDSELPKQYRFIKNLVENGLTNLTVAGTCFEYGLQNGLLTESTPASPVTSYGVAKDSLHQFLKILQKKSSLNLKWLRYFYMYGDGQSPRSLMSLLDGAVDRGDSVFPMSGGEQLRDFLPVEKIADYTIKAALQNRVNGTVNICSGIPRSVRSLVEEHIEKRNADITLDLGFYAYPDHEPMAFWGETEKLMQIENLNRC